MDSQTSKVACESIFSSLLKGFSLWIHKISGLLPLRKSIPILYINLYIKYITIYNIIYLYYYMIYGYEIVAVHAASDSGREWSSCFL